jgi:ribosome-associated heat shock protein Hsp15
LSDERQRIDKWLWHARVVRTRGAAAALAISGNVRINGARIAAAAKPVKAGDVLTIALDRGVRVLQVTGFAERRGSADSAQALYADLSRPGTPEENRISSSSGVRDPGTGRPTKRERRAIERFTKNRER